MCLHTRLVAAAAVTLCACTGASNENLLAAAETLCLDQNYEEAMVVLRDILLEDPFDAGAHYYLGLCYMADTEDFRPLIAKGEFETALRLFNEQDKTSPIARFAPEYFEVMCHINQGKTTLREIDLLASMGARHYHIEPLIARAKEYADAARAVMPAAEEVTWLDRMIETMAHEEFKGASLLKKTRSIGT